MPIRICQAAVVALTFCQSKNKLNLFFIHLDKQLLHLVRPSLCALPLTMLSSLPILCTAGNWASLHRNVIRSLLDLNSRNRQVHITKNLTKWRAFFFPSLC